ncbi:hypothetical protein HK414_13425 [Ramlibacter terrae]|uniref:Uncharacterized protein n=1 Tax=Ramlibacter terrae TaxID=2732511 RepID=A0ABX6P3W4_9BURK|nr:hypothetical protein HK414_13425 [Ramlibacter terrae]
MHVHQLARERQADARPPRERERAASSCENISNTLSSLSGAMPMPLSRTAMTAVPPSRTTRSSIWPPGSVYFAALLSRFMITCASRARSARSTSLPGGCSTVSLWPAPSI